MTCAVLACHASGASLVTSDPPAGHAPTWTLLCVGHLAYLREHGTPPPRPDQVVPFPREAWRAQQN